MCMMLHVRKHQHTCCGKIPTQCSDPPLILFRAKRHKHNVAPTCVHVGRYQHGVVILQTMILLQAYFDKQSSYDLPSNNDHVCVCAHARALLYFIACLCVCHVLFLAKHDCVLCLTLFRTSCVLLYFQPSQNLEQNLLCVALFPKLLPPNPFVVMIPSCKHLLRSSKT